jgi:hypothetical protein
MKSTTWERRFEKMAVEGFNKTTKTRTVPWEESSPFPWIHSPAISGGIRFSLFREEVGRCFLVSWKKRFLIV